MSENESSGTPTESRTPKLGDVSSNSGQPFIVKLSDEDRKTVGADVIATLEKDYYLFPKEIWARLFIVLGFCTALFSLVSGVLYTFGILRSDARTAATNAILSRLEEPATKHALAKVNEAAKLADQVQKEFARGSVPDRVSDLESKGFLWFDLGNGLGAKRGDGHDWWPEDGNPQHVVRMIRLQIPARFKNVKISTALYQQRVGTSPIPANNIFPHVWTDRDDGVAHGGETKDVTLSIPASCFDDQHLPVVLFYTIEPIP